MRLRKTILLVAAAGMMAGCTSTGNVRQPSAPETVAPEKALVLPPSGGPSIVSVVERKRGNGVEQTISLFTSSSVPGQNTLKVQFFGASGANPGAGNAGFSMINESGIAREVARSAPGVPMATSATFLQNAYGPFGYASGRSRAGDTCLYAWQQIRSSTNANTQGRNFGMIQLRLRLCDARASERQLLGIVYGYTVTGTFDGEIWNPYGNPPPADAALGRTGVPIYPDEGGYRASPMPIGYEPAPAIVTRPRAAVRSASTAQSAQGVAAVPAPIGPRVPLPGEPPQTSARPAAAAAPIEQSVRAIGVTVPSPDCIGDAAMTAACRR
ncbi:cellulose biosynthesis protein BcsN [Rhizobium johnstonii]|uniref:Cellulose biosynthesis protein BcsN n=1 Tax=Rhizobium leguminosarum bv. viciae TaxID=387 RepID=A0A8G2MQT4_RHILV|nr:cellulose biosynthesis protein BcsN [Rhizobium leguminosarum]MBY5321372.1 cellulose biosynthesis protein BcsN [Rhizobium leguminosarum]MBY5381253.1 cellulose biosynthesis protein BcsN [Rhizobium leguminosarum]MBY5424269.1 cellulose biosynthesis protein BcsN [Rhizobium leguminosarum]MCA2432558.1 cellulose biosynthesis protein BcsN [Rhizobium leguminosarum]NEH43048.1 cellulose biosynthesis protein BcsN [Rhizobium leguminosarum]